MAFIPLYDDNPHRYIGRGGQGITMGIIVVTTLVHLVVQSGLIFPPSEILVLSFALIPADLTGYDVRPEEFVQIPEWVTLLSHAFLHGDWLHLGGNMLFLWVFGDNVEDAVGHWRFILFYCLSAIGGGLVQVMLMPQSGAAIVGASGAVAGIVAAYLMLYPRAKIWVLVFGRIPLRLAAMWILGAWILVQFWSVFSAAADEGTAWWVHIGGLGAGSLLIVVLRRPGILLFGRRPELLQGIPPAVGPPIVAETPPPPTEPAGPLERR